MAKSAISSEIQCDRFDLALIGPALDERGEAATDFVKAKCQKSLVVTYDATEMEVHVDNERLQVDELADTLLKTRATSFLLEATTLGVVELCLCCRALRQNGATAVSFLYTEPLKYSAPQSHNAVHRRDFDLSSEVIGFVAVPGMGILLEESRSQNILFFVGYEGDRLERAFETLNLAPERCAVVLGVPAYKPGWEMDTFANIVPVMREWKTDGGVYFCGADNPAAVIRLLEDRYRAKRPVEEMVVAPLGTKPHGIGVALFLAQHDDVGLLYDHPQRKDKRTESVTNWHLFRINWDYTE